MQVIRTVDDLKRLVQEYKPSMQRRRCLVCTGTACVSNRSFNVVKIVKDELAKNNLQNDVDVIATGCHGFCAAGPIMVVEPDGVFYQKVTDKNAAELIKEHFINNKPYEKLMFRAPDGHVIPKEEDIPFFKKQMLIALKNRGMIDPENIKEAIARGGYSGLAKALSMQPDDIIKEVIASGLRGRGGGGFPAGVKWQSCKKAALERKEEPFIICNADEGDPGAFMDRSIIESDPHAVLEGMLIAAYAIGAKKGYVYVRKEYPLALVRLNKAIEEATEYGLLGENILNSKLSFDIEVHQGAGAFVCGESTALMASLEGKAGEPRAKYIHTVEYGLFNKPTNLNNVETYANVPQIINNGSKWFASIGTGDVTNNPWGGSKGTKVFALTGKVNNVGLVEVPMGITLREIIFEIGGGIPGNRKYKAVQTGGPSGGCLPDSMLDMQVDFDKLTEAGSMMGSGGMIVMDDRTCMVDVAKYFVNFLKDESCGKCTPCREGLTVVSEILEAITTGKGKLEDLVKLEEVCDNMTDASLCALGGTAANPVMSTLKYFKNEYVEHIKNKKCRAGVCKPLIKYEILADKCTGCTLCAIQCPVKAVSGKKKQVHKINKAKCIKCSVCYEVCRFNAVEVL